MSFRCPFCGHVSGSAGGRGSHISFKHPGEHRADLRRVAEGEPSLWRTSNRYERATAQPNLWDHIAWTMNEETHESWDPYENLSAELLVAVAKVQAMLEAEAPTAYYPTGNRIRIVAPLEDQ